MLLSESRKLLVVASKGGQFMQPMRMFFNDIDHSPFYRSIVGFDRMLDMIDSAVKGSQSSSSYPPYNIERISENTYLIELAIAGFSEQDLSIEVRDNILAISGKRSVESQSKKENQDQYLYRGIAERSFEKKFHLADHVKVLDAHLTNGLLSISLEQELPETLKPKTIKIQTTKKKNKIQKIQN